MPEGPEIKALIKRLKPYIEGKEVTKVRVAGRFHSKKPKGFRAFQRAIQKESWMIDRINSHGKFIWICLQNRSGEKEKHTYYILFRLAMKGWLDIEKWSVMPGGVVDLYLGETHHLYFWTGRFGHVEFTADRQKLDDKLDKLGVDIMNRVTKERETKIIRLFRKHARLSVADALLDQSIMAGIGNYQRSEILYDTKLDPSLKIGDVSNTKLKHLYKAAHAFAMKMYRFYLSHGIQYQYNSKERDALFRVYGKKKGPSGELVQVSVFRNRKVYWIPKHKN